MTAKAYVRPRPIRVAYLVEEQENWKRILDDIFAEAYGRWGGRFTLIVPCENGEIRPAYAPWLEVYDPDIIYSYVNLTDETVERLHERFGPAFLVRHVMLRQPTEAYAYRPSLPVSPLSVLSTVAILVRGDFMAPRRPISVVDTHIGTEP